MGSVTSNDGSQFAANVDRLVTDPPDAPLVVVMAARPSLATPWLTDAIVHVVELPRLDDAAIAALIDVVTGGKALPRAFQQQIV